MAVLSANCACSSATSVDSAEEGRKAALSFSCTWDSCPARGPAQLEIINQPMATTIASHTPLRALGVRSTGAASVSGARVLTREFFPTSRRSATSGVVPR